MHATPPALIEALSELVGAGYVSTSAPDRDAYSRDLWPRTLLEVLGGKAAPAPPDVVVWPGCVAEVAAVVRACATAEVPIVPFGAGSGVCGGTLAIHGGVMLDLKRLKALRRIDAAGGTIEVEAGRIGELLERDLERRGLTLGHFPSSILCSTVGGWLATRSAGQCSTRYGKIEDMLVDLEVVTGDGEVRRTPPVELPGVGPDWNQIFVGSEGTLGVITAATLKVFPQPEARRFRGWRVPSLQAGWALMRRTMQAGLRPAVLRMYDPLDTLMAGADPESKASKGGWVKGLLKDAGAGRGGALRRRLLREALGRPWGLNTVVRALPGRCLVVVVSEGSEAEAQITDEGVAALAREVGARDLGEGPGRTWLAHRHDVSFKLSRAYRAGLFADTFEVATTWSRLGHLYDAVRRALRPHVMVMAHFSHAYPSGCSIYFTLAGAGANPEAMRRRYDAAWKAGLDAALGAGAAVAHHHGVGLSRAAHMPAAWGAGRRWFDALKPVLDPAGVLNPGKIFTEIGGRS